MTKQIVVFATAVMVTLLALAVLWQFRIVVVYVLVSLALAATVRPIFKTLSGRRPTIKLALILLYLICLGVFGFFVFVAGRYAIGDIQRLAQTLSVLGRWTFPPWLAGSSFQRALIAWLPTPDKLLEAITGQQGQLVLPALLGFTQDMGDVISGIIIVLFLSLYWSINQIHFERLWLSLLPSELRKLARGIWRTIEPSIGDYIRSEIIQSLLAVLLLGIGYRLLGSQYPTLLAVIGALAWLIPVVGAPLAMIPPLLFGMQTSIQLGLSMAACTLGILVALQIWVEPRLFKHRWDNPILTLIILLAMSDAFGLLGILVAPPLSIVCQILWYRLVSNRHASGAAVQVSDLNERQERLWAGIREMDNLPPPLVISSMERLTELLAKAKPILQTSPAAEPSDSFHPSQSVSAEGVSSRSTKA